MRQRPTVLYACVHNSGRSVAAKVLTEHYAGGRIEVRSAGSQPSGGVNIVDDVDARVRKLVDELAGH